MQTNEAILPQPLEDALQKLIDQLVTSLGDNLYSCVLFGSAVRGDFTARSSDLNLFIVLNESNADSHDKIAEALSVRDYRVDPLILGRPGIQRNFEMFGGKFRSISRDYKVLHGADPFKGFTINDDLGRFLAEQNLRSIRMRAVRAYVLFSRDSKQYVRFINRLKASVFVALSDVIRLSEELDVPHDFNERPELIKSFFKTEDATVLDDFLQLGGRERLSNQEIQSLHERLVNLLNHAIHWIETHWVNNR